MAMHIGFYQFYPRFGRVQENLDHVIRALRGASSAIEGALIVLPELAFSGYFFRDRAEAMHLAQDPRNSSTVASLVALCREQACYLVTGMAEKARDKCFNSALLIGPEGVVHTYRKLHLFGTEKQCFDPGDIPLQVHEVRGIRVGLMVCFDWAFPEVARTLALQGADVICHPANLVLTYCQQTMLVRCIENGIWAVTANRYGTERRPHGELTFTGQSQIVAPKGALIYRGPAEGDDLHLVEVDTALARDKTLGQGNDLIADRRPAFYAEICRKQE